MKKLLICLACVLGAVLYFFYILWRVSSIPLNSDTANMTLEACDILRGNVFLSGWNLTGVTFITTDMLYFLIGAAIGGVSVLSSNLAIALMYFVCVLCALLLIRIKGNKLIAFLIFAGIALFPGIYTVDNARVHTALYAFLFLLMYAIGRAFSDGGKKYLYAIFILTALSVCGDGISLIVMVLPVLAVCLYNITANKQSDIRKNIMISLFTCLGAAAGFIMDKLFFILGTADKQYYFDARGFKTVEGIFTDFPIYIKAVTYMMNAHFFGRQLLNIKTPVLCINVLLMLFGYYIVYKNISDFIRRKTDDHISVMLSIGFAAMSVILILTDFMDEMVVGRYIIYMPILFAVLIIRWIWRAGWFDKKFYSGRFSFKIILTLFAAVLIIATAIPKGAPAGEVTQARLARFMAERNLKNGYGQFWDASYVTVATNGETTVRTVVGAPMGMTRLNWFSKKPWYEEYADFVVIRAWEVIEEDQINNNVFYTRPWPYHDYDITKPKALAAFGEPADKLIFENYEIWLYDYDISTKLYKGGTR